jgi:hypothetical protein
MAELVKAAWTMRSVKLVLVGESLRSRLASLWLVIAGQVGLLSCCKHGSDCVCHQSHITTDGQSVSQLICLGVEPCLGLMTRYIIIFVKVALLSIWGTLSDERSGLSFVAVSHLYQVSCQYVYAIQYIVMC